MISNLYSTPVMFGNLETTILQSAAQELLTVVDFCTGGDLSDVNLLEDSRLIEFQSFFQTHVITQFEEYMKSAYNYDFEPHKFKFKAWSVNGAHRYSLGFHNHRGAQLSAVFYLLVENSNKLGGKFRFHDPRFNANRGLTEPFVNQHQDYEMVPKSGDFVIFPSYLYHSVATFYGNTRLIVPVDMFSLFT